MDLPTFIQTAAAVATVIALGVAVYQLRDGNRWKRAEFVAGLIKDLEAQPKVRGIQKILEYRGALMRMSDFGGRTADEQRITSSVLAKALELPAARRVNGKVGTASYSDIEHDLRECFDCFLDGISRFEIYVRRGLVSADEFEPYLGYWFSKLSKQAVHDVGALAALGGYAKEYHPDAAAFFNRFDVTFAGVPAPAALPEQAATTMVVPLRESGLAQPQDPAG